VAAALGAGAIAQLPTSTPNRERRDPAVAWITLAELRGLLCDAMVNEWLPGGGRKRH